MQKQSAGGLILAKTIHGKLPSSVRNGCHQERRADAQGRLPVNSYDSQHGVAVLEAADLNLETKA